MTIKDLAEMTMKYGLMCQKCVCPPLIFFACEPNSRARLRA